jgi:O-antigen/teichoic acid export membrane protein
MFSAQIINTLIGFVSSIIITRILGPEGRGENTIFLSSIAFAVLFFSFSINSTISYFINSGKAKSEELLSTIIVLILTSTLLVYGTLFLLGQIGELHLALPESIQTEKYKLIFTGLYFSSLMNGVLVAYLSTFKKFKEVSLYGIGLQIFPAIIYILVYLDVIPYDHSIPFQTVVMISALVALITLIVIIFLFIKILNIKPSKKFIPIALIRQFILFSSLAYIGNIATFFNYKLDFWIIDEYWGKSDLGIYSLAAQLSQLLWILPQAIASVLYAYASSSSQEEAVRYTIKLKQLSFYATLILGITGLVLSYFFIPVLYGKEFIGAFNLMVIFLIGVIPFSIPTVLASLYAARGNFKISFVISLIILAISVTMYLTLIPRYGLMGGAISSAFAYLMATIISEIWFCKIYKVSIFNIFMIKKEVFSIGALIKRIK